MGTPGAEKTRQDDVDALADINHQWVENLLALHDAGAVRRWELLPEPGRRRRYRVHTTAGTYFLVLHEPRSFRALVQEKDLLLHLADLEGGLGGVGVLAPLRNVAGGYLFPWADRYASLFPEPLGRQLGVFEVEPGHVAQFGAWLARLHVELRNVHGHHAVPWRVEHLRSWLATAATAVPPTWQGPVERLGDLVERLVADTGRPVPGGMLHGRPEPACARFVHGALKQVMDFHGAGRGPLLLDVARALSAWTFRQDAFDAVLARALVHGYESVRPLADVERRSLPAWMRLAAAGAAVDALREFVVHQRGEAPRGFRDPSHALRQLEVLGSLGRRGFAGWLRVGAVAS